MKPGMHQAIIWDVNDKSPAWDPAEDLKQWVQARSNRLRIAVTPPLFHYQGLFSGGKPTTMRIPARGKEDMVVWIHSPQNADLVLGTA
jgi:hypothetical protein